MSENLHYIELKSISSTQDEARKLLKTSDFVCVRALSQTSGRGRNGNSWFSADGDIILSVGIKLNVSIEHLTSLSLVAGITIVEMLDPNLSKLSLKWPNDIVTKADKKKVGGILIETSIQDNFVNLIIGLGVNVKDKKEIGKETEKEIRASSLSELFPEINYSNSFYEDFSREFSEKIYSNIEILKEQKFLYFKDLWINYCIHKQADFITIIQSPNTSPITGNFEGISDDGRLLLRNSEGVHQISSGHVERW